MVGNDPGDEDVTAGQGTSPRKCAQSAVDTSVGRCDSDRYGTGAHFLNLTAT